MDWLALAIGAGGLVASVIGLVFAFLARRAAKSAEQAAREARNSVSRTLCLVSVQRALTVIGRLNTLHRDGSWVAALELYRELRTLLNDVSGMMPQGLEQSRAEVQRGIGQIISIQSFVEGAISQGLNSGSFPALDELLNSMQTTLEALTSSLMPSSERDGESHG